MNGRVYLREVEITDLPIFFSQQTDPVASQLAAFLARKLDAFMARWNKILAEDRARKRTILLEARVAGNALCFERSLQLLTG